MFVMFKEPFVVVSYKSSWLYESILVCLCLLMSQGFRFNIVERQAKCLHVGDPESDSCQILSCNALSEVDELYKS